MQSQSLPGYLTLVKQGVLLLGERPQALPPVDLHVVSKGTGAAVLLVHGFLGSAFSWRHLMDPLSKAGFAAVAVDLPGFGSTRWPWELDHSHITLADACAPVLRRMAGIPAHVIGHSMGAKVALWLALRHPALVDSLTVVAPAVLTGGVPGWVRTRPVAAVLRRLLRRRWTSQERFAADLDRFYGRPVDADVRSDYWRRYQHPELQAEALAHLRDSRGPHIRPHLSRIKCPVHLIWGGADRVVRPDHAQRLADLLTAVPGRARITMLPGMDHFPPESAPEAFLKAALPFLVEQRG